MHLKFLVLLRIMERAYLQQYFPMLSVAARQVIEAREKLKK